MSAWSMPVLSVAAAALALALAASVASMAVNTASTDNSKIYNFQIDIASNTTVTMLRVVFDLTGSTYVNNQPAAPSGWTRMVSSATFSFP